MDDIRITLSRELDNEIDPPNFITNQEFMDCVQYFRDNNIVYTLNDIKKLEKDLEN
jgi:hypothetical protein